MTDPKLEERRAVDTVLLAVVRTELANRRTFLAYVKTTIALVAAGFAMQHLFHETLLVYLVGVALQVCAAVVLVAGVVYFTRTRKLIVAEREASGLPPRGGLG